MDQRQLSSLLAGLALGVIVFTRPLPAQSQTADVLLRGGTVVDGTGAPERRADVAVRGDRVVFVGDARRAGIQARRAIDATGLIVAPGFIDPHTHTLQDLSNPPRPANENYLMQGVTTLATNTEGGGTTDVGKT